MVTLESDASLLEYNTFGIDCRAKGLAVVREAGDVAELAKAGRLCEGGYVVIGQGSNLVFGERYEGLALVMRNKGVKVVTENEGEVTVEAEAGEVWDEFVRRCVAEGWHGVENLTAIPGTVGASAVQNIGAYGVEAKDVIESVKAYDVRGRREVEFEREECGYGYRESRFKHEEGKRYVVTSVRYRLSKIYEPVLTYKALADELGEGGAKDAETVSRAVERIRWSKLPKPEDLGNAGSFFKNPVVTRERYEWLKKENPDMPAHETEDGMKLAAGWLIDRCGWKGRTMGRCGVYEKQALVLVNNGGCSGEDVRRLADAIKDDVRGRYGVELECEAEFVRSR